MAQTTQLKHRPDPDEQPITDRDTETINSAELLDLLHDSYVQTLLELLGCTPKTCRELTNNTDMSRPTVYRRVNKLKEHGLVNESTRICPDGHHRSEYTLVEVQVSIQINNDITLSIN